MRKLFNVLIAGTLVSFFLLGFIGVQKPWDVPDKYKNMKNPTKADQSSITLGKELYTKHCKSCHGPKGLGDGPKAANLKTKMRSFTSAEFKAQKPGVIYYQSFVGRDEMPNFEKKILAEEERWAIINYLMTLK
ncbi:MAG TPA: cytochrome c [Bacteroidia bacterium]|nr:cytochrome c [Sphingobacteriales bacterium]HPD63882.1 cytochrome c [Bacteroidia bacterium]HRS57757.1 cytochrome c [Bacteroidia bacterium]HRU67302.1 cytochrome c [Bacteroidia bacterium]